MHNEMSNGVPRLCQVEYKREAKMLRLVDEGRTRTGRLAGG